MQQFQNYPNYGQWPQNYNPMFGAQQRLAQMEQQYPQFAQQNMYQSQIQPVGLNGKVVDDFGTIIANDVPMDGNGAIFVKRDYSEIQLRNWNANGTISTISYKPVNNDSDLKEVENSEIKVDLSDEVKNVIMKRFDLIESRFDKLEKSWGSNSIKQVTTKSKE